MDRKEIKDAMFPECPVRNVLSRIMDKWTMLTLYTLEQQGTMRFNDIRRAIPDVSQKMLTNTLKSMMSDGLVSRMVIPEVPVNVEYTLTERAHNLMPLLDELLDWALQNFDSILADRARNSK